MVGLPEVLVDLADLGVRAPGHSGQMDRRLRPGRALVRELHRRVVVHSDDEVPIVFREPERRQGAHAVPERRAGDHGPRGVVRPDHLEGLSEILVPEFRSQLAVRLVQHLEEDRISRPLKVLAHLPPEGHDLRPEGLRVLCHVREVVEIQDDGQLVSQGVLDDPIGRLPPGVAEAILGAHPIQGVQVHANALQARLMDEAKVLLLEAGLLWVLPDRVVSQDIHAPPNPFDLLECLRVGRCDRGRGR